MGIFKPRKRRLTIRQIAGIKRYANKECHKQILRLNETEGLCSCPICKTKDYVRCNGTNRGLKKFVCESPYHEKRVCFSTSTSYESMEIYRDAMTNSLCLFTQTNSTIRGIRAYNESSKYFVEMAIEGLYGFINQGVNQPILKIEENADIATVFLDLSGVGLAKNKAIILARIGGNVIFEIVTTSNHLSAHEILASIKDRLKISNETKIIFVTDGETCFVDSIKHFFPEAIHIRQFHKRSCKGLIYIHLIHEEKEYTIRCLWDSVLNEGTPSKKVVEMRERKAKEKLARKEQKNKPEYSELSKEVMVWEGTVYLPRGTRRLLQEKKTKKTNDDTTLPKQKPITSPSDSPKLIFKGELKEAKEISVVDYCFKILIKIFGGLYITSNIIETTFNFKSKLYPHRTIKYGDRILVCVIYNCLVLKGKSKEELIRFFKEKVITYDFIMQNVLQGSGLQKNKQEEPSFCDIIKKAITDRKKLIIHYCDKNHKHSSRIITPLKINTDNYSNTTQIESFCNLRNEKRTFYLERIRDVVIYEPETTCF